MAGTPTAPPDPTWWRILILFTLAGFIESMFWGQITTFTPLYLPQLGVALADVPGWLGTISVVSGVLGIPFLPLWGALADRYARQPVIVRSFVVHLIAGTLALLAGNVWVFVLARAMGSFALGNSGLMMTTLAERTPRPRVGLAFAVMNGGAPVGAFLGPLIGGPIVDTWGFRALMGLDMALMVGCIAGMAWGYRDHFVGTDRGPLLRMAWASVDIVWRAPRLRLLFPALFLLFAGRMLALTYVAVAVGTLYHGTDLATAVGLVVGAGGFAALVVSPLVGALGDRLGHWPVLFAGGALMVALWPLPFFTADLGTFGVAWAAINGVGAGVFAISFNVLADSAAPAVRGRVMSFAYLPVNLGFAVGPAIGSLVTRWSILAIFPTAALLTAGGLAVLALAARAPAPARAGEEGLPARPDDGATGAIAGEG
ncbi:MAG TPA: MFS transporter [Chloroflexia bacterium]|nr:MFS transporter [Chloroflexia bacterium]